ncbi:MAG: ATP-dependent sacrificial sulfur transferase LarE [Clostridia bacterium]|nr:ATP-dependent sacrificial sulfur transferase LarE [Clostridia bacterium]
MSHKIDRVRNLLSRYDSALVACSGGVDSGLLLKLAAETLGDRVTAVTALTPFSVPGDMVRATEWGDALGVPHLTVRTGQMDDPEFMANRPDRCYHCKSILFTALSGLAKSQGLSVILDGTNADDAKTHRPGLRAAKESGVVSPLCKAGLTKAEIREAARQYDIPHWDQPSESCFCTRIPFGRSITLEDLKQVALAEDFLRQLLGLRVVRVRHHGDTVRIETETEALGRLVERPAAQLIDRYLRAQGFRFVTVDLGGYRTGSLDP